MSLQVVVGDSLEVAGQTYSLFKITRLWYWFETTSDGGIRGTVQVKRPEDLAVPFEHLGIPFVWHLAGAPK